ncbi:hypothetical protein AVEN_225884-1 [Araneus ventricosus]|uniref:Uncharacterized protein n=1 Tax=Araneus ventricosus TaxID=182803 RepID=A0A4Y2BC67_ARAVE|nr:hypothetical protein AVEN_225884-1 [Araneus ventricosus]
MDQKLQTHDPKSSEWNTVMNQNELMKKKWEVEGAIKQVAEAKPAPFCSESFFRIMIPGCVTAKNWRVSKDGVGGRTEALSAGEFRVFFFSIVKKERRKEAEKKINDILNLP